MEKLFIIDASGYLYSSYFAIRNMTNSQGESTNALFGFIRSTLKLLKDFSVSHLVAVFDGPRNAKKREEIYADYKLHRSAMPPDLLYQIAWAREFCSFMGIPLLNIPEVEADDAMGCVANWATTHGSISYLCTSDKDLCQIVSQQVFLLNTRKDNQIIGPDEVEAIHGVPPHQIVDLLSLTGDSSDNVPGIPGIGPKTAATLLKQFGSLDSLLSRLDEIPNEKRRSLLKENSDKAILSRRLVTIDSTVQVPQEESFYRLRPPQVSLLKSFYSKMNFNTLLIELDTMLSEKGGALKPEQPPEESYLLIEDKKSLEDLIAFLSTQKEVCFNTEATHLNPMRAELVGIGFGIEPGTAWYIPANGSLSLDDLLKALKPLFENPKISFFGHNVKYDYHILLNYGIQVSSLSFDTILASYLLNSHLRQHSLDLLTLQFFGKVKMTVNELVGKGRNALSLREIPIEKLGRYCCENVDFTCRIKCLLEKELKERQLNTLLEQVELPLLKVLASMERKGIYLDLPCLQGMSQINQVQLRQIQKQIFDLAGEEFNINSPQQLSRILQEKLHIVLPKKTATGFSTNAEILEELKYTYPIASVILDYRSLEKLRSTYIESLPQEINIKTSRIHCTFNQFVAATGRLSCQDPNLQNIPVRTEAGRQIREAFRPQYQGWSYLAADYSQVELRLLAHLSEDPNLIQAFQNNEDIHAYTAASIFNVPLHQVTKEQRYQAKAVNFGIVYGQQAFGLAKELRIDVKEAAAFIDMYFKRYKHVREYLEYSKALTHKTGKATTLTGRERIIPEINSKNGQLRMLAERLAVNTPIQGTAADLIKLAMLAIHRQLSTLSLKGYMILQIHDELIFEIPDSEIEIFVPLVRQAMQEVFKLKVPLIVDITLGKNWKEC